MALAALVGGISQSTENVAYLRDKMIGHWVAVNKATEYAVMHRWPSVGVRSGISEMALREWPWQVTISNTAEPKIRRVEIEVFGAQQESVVVATLISFVSQPAMGRHVDG